MTLFSKKKILSQKWEYDAASANARITVLENNEYKITYYEVISGTSGTLTVPTHATINSGEFGSSGNAILSEIDVNQKPTFKSPQTAGGAFVTASLNATTGAWLASGVYTNSNVALIYSVSILAKYYQNLNYDRIVESEELDYEIATQAAVDTGTVNDQIVTPKTLKNSSQWSTKEDVSNKQTDLTASATKYPTVNAVNTGLANKVTSNASITGATKTKITYDSKGLVTSGTDATTADINDSTNRRYVTDAQLTVIGNTSGTNSGNETTSTLGTTINGATAATPNDTDLVATVESSVVKKITWTNVKAFLKTYFDTLYNPYKYKYLTTSDGSTTSSTSNTLSTSVLVPANTFAVGDLILLQARGFKTGGNATFTIRLYVNTTNDLSGPTLLGTFSSSSIGNTMINIQRFAVIKSSTVTQVPTATSNNANDFVQSTTTSANISHTSDQYYIVALQCANASDSAVCSYFLLQKQ